MREIDNIKRVENLISHAVQDFELNLKGISVLTEAATGPYFVTPLIAAIAGASTVIAVTSDSKYGRAIDISNYVNELALRFGVRDQVFVTAEPAHIYANESDLITNLGFVRPINKMFIQKLKKNTAISLMCEPWEYRNEDVDTEACNIYDIAVAGTNESHQKLKIFRYVGMTALKILLQSEIEVFRSKILIIGSGVFGDEIEFVLNQNGAHVIRINPSSAMEAKEHLANSDAIVLAEHHEKQCLIGGDTGIPCKWLEDAGILVVHICGEVNLNKKEQNKIRIYPNLIANMGYMSVATDYVGPKPVVDLHTAGLKVGELLIRNQREYLDTGKAISKAVASGLALAIQNS